MEYVSWNPIDGIEDYENFDLESLSDTGILVIILKHAKTKRRLCFNFAHVNSYRNIDEGYLLKSNHVIKGGFNIALNSPFLKWFHEESYEQFSDYNDLVHYCIYVGYRCIDILSWKPVEVKWLE